MAVVIDKFGVSHQYTTITEHEGSICLDGNRFVQGVRSDFNFDSETPKIISPETFLQLFTYQEVKAVERLTKGDATADPVLAPNEELAYWWDRVNSPRLTEVQMGLPSVQDALQGLVALGVLSEERLAQVNAIQLV